MRAVIGNFLSTFISRNSTLDGFWAFGFVVSELERLELDLLRPPKVEKLKPTEALAILASKKFHEQLEKSGFEIGAVKEAVVTLTRLAPMVATVGDESLVRKGFEVAFEARASLLNGQRFDSVATAFVSPHDIQLERHSAGVA